MWATARSLATQVALGSVLGSLLLAGCTAAGPQSFVHLSGSSGTVSWEIVDVSQTVVPGQEIRWDYTLILRSQGGAIQFEMLETGSEGAGEGVHTSPFTDRLEPRDRLLINSSYTLQRNKMDSEAFGDPVLGRQESVRIFHRLSGKDLDGRPVRIDVRFTLHGGLSVRTSESPSPASPGQGGGGAAEPAAGESARPGGTPLARERIGAEATPLERSLLDDLRDGSLDRHSPLDAALIVSGARDRQELDALRRRFEQAAAPIVARLNRLSTPAERAPALLGALHPARTSQAPILREYALDATTLIDVIETGRYNCVSATIVFWLLAGWIGLDANPVLVPSHARAAVRIGDRRVPVEATEPYGYDPSEAERRQIQRRFRADVDGAPSYAEEEATDVDFLALLGAIYTNVSTFRARDGDAAAAAAVARRADLFVAPAERLVLNRFRVGLLNEMAVDHSKRGRHQDAVNALQEARRLVAQENDTAAFLDESLTAIALAWLYEAAPSAEDTTVLAFSDRFAESSAVKDEVHSFALRLVAHRRTERAEWEPALRDLREAAALTRITEYRDQVARDLAHIELRYIDDLASRDTERAWQAFQALQRDWDDEELSGVRRLVSQRLVVARLRHLVTEQRCEELEEPLALWGDLSADADPDPMRASCYGQRGVALWKGGQLDRAAGDFRRAYRLAPREPAMEQNLVAALQRLIAGQVQEGRCQDARPLIAEGLSLAPNDPRFQRAATTCGPGP